MVRNCDGQERACCVACQELERRALRHTSMAEGEASIIMPGDTMQGLGSPCVV